MPISPNGNASPGWCTCYLWSFSFRMLRWVQTMIFAIQEINRDKELLPNVTLGYKIYDTCGTHFQSLKAALSLIRGVRVNASNCSCLPSVPVLIGDSGSTQSIVVATLVGIFTLPMLLQYLKNVQLTMGSSEKLSFDKNGDPFPSYDLINWQKGSNGSILFVNVGQYNDTEELKSKLQIDDDLIEWCGAQKKVPSSVCSESCLPGTRKAVQPGHHLCCFDCIPCNTGEISNQSDSIECIKCPPDFWSNKARDQCAPKEVEYISFKEAMGTTLLAVALLGTFLTLAVLSLFTFHRNSPIVKANNSSLSFMILLSLALCFLCSISFIGEPTPWSCMLRHTAFGISFAFCLSCILGKTLVVLIAFKIQHPNSYIFKWFSPLQQKILIFICASIQVIICLTWLIVAPPWPVKTAKNESSTILLECGVGSMVAFCLVLGYIGFLLCICFGLAFFARNLPNQFNETKFITFSMLMSSTVWITFIPTYVSTPGKYTVAVEIFAILASSFGLLTCIFAPKCYVILLKPEKNSKAYLRNRKSSAKK